MTKLEKRDEAYILEQKVRYKTIMLVIILWACVGQVLAFDNRAASLPYIGRSFVDTNMIPLHDYGNKTGLQYNPLFIANYALTLYLGGTSSTTLIPDNYKMSDENKKNFLKVVSWLSKYAVKDKDGALWIPYKFEWSSISPPWYSGITQARVAKVFICAYIETKDRKYL